jgi:hypothetical protein
MMSKTKREELLNKKAEVDQRLIAAKDGIARAKREHAANGKWVDPTWLTDQETYIRRLGFSSQELQRQIGDLRREEQQRLHKDMNHHLYNVLLERMSREEVDDLFRKARERQRENEV